MLKTPVKPRRMAPEERREEIIRAAVKCLEQYGYSGLTARKISAISGLSLGHISYHFDSMHALLVESYVHASKQLFEASSAALIECEQTPTARLGAFLGVGFSGDFLRRNYIRLRIDLWSAAQIHEDIAQIERHLYDSYRRSLTELVIQTMPSKTQDLERRVDSIMAALDGLWLDWSRRKEVATLTNVLDTCMLLATH